MGTKQLIIRIQPDGTVLDQYGHYLAITAITIPSHGRLIDADALIDSNDIMHKTMLFGGEMIYEETAIKNAPTIIPSDKDGG